MTHDEDTDFEQECSVVVEMYNGDGMMTTQLIYVGSYDGWHEVKEEYDDYDLEYKIFDAVIEPNEESFEGTLGTVIRMYHDDR
tara:strand:+ start:223 stop:471 length:249 start_codon:yes stop_codon:yes gene_type:complete